MDIALVVAGLFVAALVVAWLYAHLNDAREINEEEEAQVRTESPEEYERSQFGDEEKRAEQEAIDKHLFSND